MKGPFAYFALDLCVNCGRKCHLVCTQIVIAFMYGALDLQGLQ